MRTTGNQDHLTQKLLLLLSLCLAAYYWANSNTKITCALAITKVSSTALLTLISHRFNKPIMPDKTYHLLTKALAFHSIGDGLIEVPDLFNLPKETVLLAIGVFLIAHLITIKQLSENYIQTKNWQKKEAYLIAAIACYSLFFTGFFITNTTGILQIAIPFYSGALTTVLALSSIQKKQRISAAISALCYMASDQVVAYGLFIERIPFGTMISFALYFAALLIALSRQGNHFIPHIVLPPLKLITIPAGMLLTKLGINQQRFIFSQPQAPAPPNYNCPNAQANISTQLKTNNTKM